MKLLSNTFLPTTPWCLKECQTAPPSTHTHIHTHTHTHTQKRTTSLNPHALASEKLGIFPRCHSLYCCLCMFVFLTLVLRRVHTFIFKWNSSITSQTHVWYGRARGPLLLCLLINRECVPGCVKTNKWIIAINRSIIETKTSGIAVLVHRNNLSHAVKTCNCQLCTNKQKVYPNYFHIERSISAYGIAERFKTIQIWCKDVLFSAT